MKVITIESSAFTALTEQIAEIAVYVRAVSGERKEGLPAGCSPPRGGAPGGGGVHAHAQRCGAARCVGLVLGGRARGRRRGGGGRPWAGARQAKMRRRRN